MSEHAVSVSQTDVINLDSIAKLATRWKAIPWTTVLVDGLLLAAMIFVSSRLITP